MQRASEEMLAGATEREASIGVLRDGDERDSEVARRRRTAERWGGRASAALAGAALLWAGALGCAGPRSLQEAPLDAGRTMLIRAPADRVLPVVRTAVRDAGFQVDREQREAGRVWSLHGRVLLSDQSLAADVRAVVEELADDRTEVRVLTRRYLPTRLGGGDPYAEAIFDRLVREFLPEPAPGSGAGS